MNNFNISFNIQEKEVIHLNNHNFPGNLTDNNLSLQNGEIEISLDYLVKNIIYTGNNNPGFDIGIFEKDSSNLPIFIGIECKFSNPASQTKLNYNDIDKKYKLFHEKFAPYLVGKLIYFYTLNFVGGERSSSKLGKIGLTKERLFLK